MGTKLSVHGGKQSGNSGLQSGILGGGGGGVRNLIHLGGGAGMVGGGGVILGNGNILPEHGGKQPGNSGLQSGILGG